MFIEVTEAHEPHRKIVINTRHILSVYDVGGMTVIHRNKGGGYNVQESYAHVKYLLGFEGNREWSK
jgi:hypothetical protein